MRKILLITISLFALIAAPIASAQGMPASDDHTAREEAEGKEIWEKLQAKEVTCENLSDDDFGALGEYFMGQMVGDSHEAMNTMMERMMGKEGEEQMHVVMGKRLSGCEPNAQVPQSGVGFMPMMWMMGSAGTSAMSSVPNGSPQVGGGGNTMMGGWNGLGLLGWIPMLLFWVLLILGVVALIRYLTKSGDNKEGKTPLDILKERYARGEINKKEFEEMKKNLT